jgi:glyoxylase-like metal-dependent hydrolase (beta-lactamase superfamily II)
VNVAPASTAAGPGIAEGLAALDLEVFERGWLSANGILCHASSEPTVLIDTGYGAHADLTLALVRASLGARSLDTIVNTHLHSDHCGGNAILQRAYPNARTLLPATQFDVVVRWDEDVLTYRSTGQQCERFRADAGLAPGDLVRIGRRDWQVHAAPGHDPDALMLFEPAARVLISGDALWEKRLAIVFPALDGDLAAFDHNLAALDAIEALQPALVIPGHGRPFTDAAGALAVSRKRLEHYRRHPRDHTLHARKALVMFHMLEHQSRDERELIGWLCKAPVVNTRDPIDETTARECVDGLVDLAVLVRADGRVRLA